MGRQFFDSTMPRIADALSKLADKQSEVNVPTLIDDIEILKKMIVDWND